MNILGFNINRAAPRIAMGSAFAERTLTHQVLEAKGYVPSAAVVQAATPHLPVMSAPMVSTNQNEPFSSAQIYGLEERAITSDARENWYLALPEKITPQQGVNILRAALGGDIWQQYMLVRMMEDRWPKFRMACHQLREAVAYTKFNVVPYAEDGGKPSKIAMEKAGLITRAMRGMTANPFNDEGEFSSMIYDLTNAILMGVSLVELIWARKRSPKYGEEMLPRAAAFVHPRHFTFTNQGQLAVFNNDYDQGYNNPRFNGAQSQGRNPILGTTPDPDKFLCAQFKSTSGSCLMAGFMRPVVYLWIARNWCQEWALNQAKQWGNPTVATTYKPGQSDAVERAKLMAFLKQAGPERRIVMPEGTVTQVIPSQNLGVDNPQRWFYEESDRQVLYLFLGQTGTTDATPGKLGDSNTHADVKQERIQYVADWVCNDGLKQYIRAILRQNYGNDDECPSVSADFTKPLSAPEVGGLVSSITASQMPVRADEWYKKTGFTQPEPGDLVYQGGQIKEMLTEEEQFQQQLEQEQAQLEMQAAAAPEQGQPVGARHREVAPETILATASPIELAELESAVLAAERAPHLNGEMDEVNRILTTIKAKRL